MREIVTPTQGRKDLKRIKVTIWRKILVSFSKIVDQLKDNPCQYNQNFEKLVSPILGFYSRRINV